MGHCKTRLNLVKLLGLLLCAVCLSACSTSVLADWLPSGATSSPKPPPAICQNENIKMTSQEIYFDLNSTALDADAIDTIMEIAAEAKQSPTMKINVIGYTDKSGHAAYNHRLSTERAKAVAAALKEQGVKARNLKTDSCGADAPAVPTLEKVKFRENRRVVIQTQKK